MEAFITQLLFIIWARTSHCIMHLRMDLQLKAAPVLAVSFLICVPAGRTESGTLSGRGQMCPFFRMKIEK